ncbi:hypothetical protein ISN76_10510 [Dyella halodurans]|uniref:Uncharacterized protein n=1 Tax=Dyella halodurans TaxID=1920171 RepID=A0ABV9C2E5_9GAMM|nr:hypothetical protein [Dyella halodurans]
MRLTGSLFVGDSEIAAAKGTLKALSPAMNPSVEVDFALGGPSMLVGMDGECRVGMTSIERPHRPMNDQHFPEELIPEPLQEANPLGMPRRGDGQ